MSPGKGKGLGEAGLRDEAIFPGKTLPSTRRCPQESDGQLTHPFFIHFGTTETHKQEKINSHYLTGNWEPRRKCGVVKKRERVEGRGGEGRREEERRE